jgi:hypothetical protein
MSDVSTMRIDTLVQFARALGADLDIGLRFRDGSHRRLAID